MSDDDQSVIDDALSHVIATLHGVNTDGEIGEIQLGPTPTAEVLLEGTPIRVVLDTGLPVTIVSLQFLLQVLAGKQPEHQSVEVKRISCRPQFPSTATVEELWTWSVTPLME